MYYIIDRAGTPISISWFATYDQALEQAEQIGGIVAYVESN